MELVSWDSNYFCEVADSGAVFVKNAALQFGCVQRQAVRAGDHELVILEICQAYDGPSDSPLIFQSGRFLTLAEISSDESSCFR
ncbi:flavin reductase [Rathayibacter toxicus]|uniref:Flavin reductase like domain-containing protein n=1 Tax=Rathayibacter toxicus TaxID=145458 RepID=A0A2S5Y9M0_9MICO|nr:hypothetical protein C5D15_01135 [Rathayibacter toxicus]PPG48090.1 hypothetical protein C5D16_01150 [Rathayibacter toxicus]PPH25303.1 hypothetical protein C5D17_01110 [Rathayibacter toxicus]PPH58549.1 hypothetical protein C5D30_01120 [Rathayibacter toxicus]PPH61177.1 hypothetical protein C5C93_01130 [Rathayibacter toxicus]